MTSWKLAPGRAAEVCARYHVDAEAPAPADLEARAYFEALVAQEHGDEAVAFLAHALPRRDTIWWGCLCLWDVVRPAPSAVEDAALGQIVQWVLEPSEPRRRAIAEAADSLEDSPVEFLAQAVTYSGETISAPGLPVVPPPPYLAHRLVAGAIRLAVATGDDSADLLRNYLEWGIDIADGKLHWSQA